MGGFGTRGNRPMRLAGSQNCGFDLARWRRYDKRGICSDEFAVIFVIMTIISKIFSCGILVGTLAFTGCELLPKRESVNLPTQPAPTGGQRGSGESVGSETYYEMTEDNRRRMMEGGGTRDMGGPQDNSGQQTTDGADTGNGEGAGGGQDSTAAPTPKTGIPVEGKAGYIISPYTENPDHLIDVQGLPPGTEVKDPYSPGNNILVP